MAFAGQAESVYQKFSAMDASFEGYFIIIGGSRGAPSRGECSNIKRRYNLTMPVLYAPQGRMKNAGLDDRHWHYVLDDKAEIYFREQYTNQTFQMKLEELLNR